MKHFFLAAFLCCSLVSLAATFPASDSRVVYVGRTQVTGDCVSFDWAGVYVRIRFVGKELSLRMSDDVCHDYFNLIVDGPISADPDRIISSAPDTTVLLCQFKKKGEHTVILQKRTEGEQGTATFREFITDGQLLQAEPLKARQIEFVGDSYTCGYGAEMNCVKTDPFTPETESQARTYAAIVSRYFDADYYVVAHSGMGIARNYATKFPGWYMPDRYLQIFDKDSTAANRWDAKACPFRPALTVVYLGTNDFSTGLQPHYELFKKNYYRLIREIKDNYGEDHPVLCVCAKGDEYQGIYVQRLVVECGMKNVNYVIYEPTLLNDDSELGASWHPNYLGHQKIAHELIPHISTVTGWLLTGNPIK